MPNAPGAMSRQFPPTPPDFVPYNATNTKGSGAQGSYEQSWSVPAIAGHEENGYPTADHYGQAAGPIQMPHHEQFHEPYQFHESSNRLAPLTGHYEHTGHPMGAPMGAPLLPPMQTYSQATGENFRDVQREALHGLRAQQPREDRRSGGISAELDYDVNLMTDFVSENAQSLYALLVSRIYMTDIDIIGSLNPAGTVTATFRAWVSQVLRATRLPSVTILTGFHYLTERMMVISGSQQFEPSDGVIYRLLTVALLLGSKFQDDNTFHTQSWADVSGIAFDELKVIERVWLKEMDYKLHFNPNAENGFNRWMRRWREYEHRAQLRAERPMQLTPIDTNVRQQQSLHSAYSNPSFSAQRLGNTAFASHGTASHQQYSSGYAYNPWFGRQPANTPPSTVDTRVTNSNYIGNASVWGAPGRWSQDQVQPQQAPPQPQQPAPLFPHQPNYTARWNDHNIWSDPHQGYHSMYSVSRPQLSYFNTVYRLQSVMG